MSMTLNHTIQICLNHLIKYFFELRGFLENRLAGPDTEYLLDAPKVLQEVQAARSAEIRLESLAKLGKELLADLPGYEEVAARLSSAQKEAEDKRRDLVESWVTFNRIQYISLILLKLKQNFLISHYRSLRSLIMHFCR